MHKAQLVLNAIYHAVLASIGRSPLEEVIKNRAILPDKHPSVSVMMGNDVIAKENANFIDFNLDIYTDIYLVSSDSDLDAQILEIRKEIHKAILSTHNLGLGFVLKVTPQGQQSPTHSGEGDSYSSVTRLSWIVMYRVNYLDPSL